VCSSCNASHPDEQAFVRDFNKRQQERKAAKQTELPDAFQQALASAWTILSVNNSSLIQVRK